MKRYWGSTGGHFSAWLLWITGPVALVTPVRVQAQALLGEIDGNVVDSTRGGERRGQGGRH